LAYFYQKQKSLYYFRILIKKLRIGFFIYSNQSMDGEKK